MQGRILRVRELSSADDQAWRDLAARAVEPNPLFEPDVVVPAARHQSFGADISLIQVSDHGRWVACVPIRPAGQWQSRRLPRLTTNVRRSAYIGTPLVDPAAGAPAVRELLSTIASQERYVRHRGLLELDNLRQGPVAEWIFEAVEDLRLPLHVESYPRGMLRRRPAFTYFDDHSGHHLSNLRRLRRQMEEFLGAEVRCVDRSGDPEIIPRFIELEVAGYKRANRVALATIPGEPEYFAEICDRLRRLGRLLVLTLEAGPRLAAAYIALRGGEGFFIVKLAYDEDLGRFSPGLNLHLDAIRHFHEHTDAQWIDTCTGPNNQTLLRFYTDHTTVSNVLLAFRGGRDGLFVRYKAFYQSPEPPPPWMEPPSAALHWLVLLRRAVRAPSRSN